MASALFRVRLPSGESRLARGDGNGPAELLSPDLSLDDLLSGRASEFAEKVGSESRVGRVPSGVTLLAPIGSQEVWGAGVTYLRSRDARMEEALNGSPYDRVYEAIRPEIFFKSPGWRVRGPGEPIAIRADSAWNVPEPELTLVLAADLEIAGYTLGNDVSSRSIEGENLLYLPQAKTYDGSCALGPCIVLVGEVTPPFDLHLEILRAKQTIWDGATSTGRMRRSFEELASYLGRGLTFPVGVFLLTGTGLVPEASFTLASGDVVRITSPEIGALQNAVEELAMVHVDENRRRTNDEPAS
jgi:2-dehydro-3-deoxy-D-arabinonate dehydratase